MSPYEQPSFFASPSAMSEKPLNGDCSGSLAGDCAISSPTTSDEAMSSADAPVHLRKSLRDVIFFYVALGPHPQRLPPLAHARGAGQQRLPTQSAVALEPHPQRLPPLAHARGAGQQRLPTQSAVALGPHPQRLPPLAHARGAG